MDTGDEPNDTGRYYPEDAIFHDPTIMSMFLIFFLFLLLLLYDATAYWARTAFFEPFIKACLMERMALMARENNNRAYSFVWVIQVGKVKTNVTLVFIHESAIAFCQYLFYKKNPQFQGY